MQTARNDCMKATALAGQSDKVFDFPRIHGVKQQPNEKFYVLSLRTLDLYRLCSSMQWEHQVFPGFCWIKYTLVFHTFLAGMSVAKTIYQGCVSGYVSSVRFSTQTNTIHLECNSENMWAWMEVSHGPHSCVELKFDLYLDVLSR